MNAQLHTPSRSDGADARQRLLLAALKLFAEQGFGKTSTREIAEAAGVNLASISYYFGDKAGLYRATFSALCDVATANHVTTFAATAQQSGEAIITQNECFAQLLALPTEQALTLFFSQFLNSLLQEETARQVKRLHVREMLEPTGMLEAIVASDVRPPYDCLRSIVAQHLGISVDDKEVARLALLMFSMSISLFMADEVNRMLIPDLIATPEAVVELGQRVGCYAMGMVEAEAKRRRALPHN
jgi:AcrR family transcriptional regulator